MPHCDSAATAAAQRRISVTYRPSSSLRAYDRNAQDPQRRAQVRQIRRSIDEFGFTNPILLRDDGATIGAGHGRWAAAQLEPAIAEVPTITLDGLTEAQWRAYVIADNKLALNASWDEAMLQAEFDALVGMGLDLELLGFTQEELQAIFANTEAERSGLTDDDDAPPLRPRRPEPGGRLLDPGPPPPPRR
jgi:ParB-like chromosome segregation protein Spo0J